MATLLYIYTTTDRYTTNIVYLIPHSTCVPSVKEPTPILTAVEF